MDILYVILILEAQVLGLFALLALIGNLWEWIDKKLNPRHPYCDIDPRCHPAFVWDEDGNGRIGNHLVIPTRP